TTTGSQLYMQVGDANEVHVVDAALLQLFPTSADDWRDAALLPLRGLTYSRMEVRSAGRSFEVQKDVTNKVWRITKPMATRADNPKLTHLLQQLELWPVRRFVSDDPQADLEKYGLRPAEMELAFGEGTNDFVSVQFGKASVEDPTMIYARRSSHTNIVLVPKEWMEPLRSAFSELRDRKIATLVPAAVDSIDITGAESMSIKRQTNGTWRIEGGKGFLADSILVTNMLLQMSELEVVEFEKDVVTDFTTYGLQMPSLQYTVWTNGPAGTNGNGTTNHMLFRLDVGRAEGTKIYVRRAGEDSVYSLALGDIQQLPSKRYELRDRGIWEFSTNQITKVSVGQHGLNRDIVRNPKGDWVLAPGSQGVINPFAVDEALYRLGRMRVERWVGVGADRLAAFGITDRSHRISVEVKSGEKTEIYVLRIGDRLSPSRRPYGAAMLDGDAVIFELPVAVFPSLQSDLSIPAP
ncbi:MAG TPA: DUF4340 domain-containing protein, partial [Roseimicrobium sp.]|nr:DUF4340 domain-containing protein [Roseimicrobium sp.]